MKTIFNWLVTHKTGAVLLSIGWAALIFVGCLLPGKDIPSLSIFEYDKLVHFGIFAALAFLLLCIFRNPSFIQSFRVLFFCSAYGYALEVLQGSGWVTGRSFDLYDALADGLGALMGIGVFFVANRLCR
ncbi:hypothetical protein DBR32_05975 [Taibaiella sp. KBW10]|uniref:VanZ family protein n=1 Tax=Taibaiella sp. KBW10 TaxID=2153357 RepID=UPI000F5B3D67|nr:VanZ family protein [Taibaiella sp. KBW10]RQO31503.1 hypothetical protein DBR32_05975 [Taibaiella sp. KBW10]